MENQETEKKDVEKLLYLVEQKRNDAQYELFVKLMRSDNEEDWKIAASLMDGEDERWNGPSIASAYYGMDGDFGIFNSDADEKDMRKMNIVKKRMRELGTLKEEEHFSDVLKGRNIEIF